MALQNITDISVDFYDKKYILINSKQFDKNSRFLSVTCRNRGNDIPINSGEHAAYIRYRKADENGVFNECQIDRKGKVLVELTEQMLTSDGMCCADFVLVNKGDAKIDVDTGEVLYIDNASILSSMVFYIDVSEVAVNNLQIESSYEYDGLNTALQKAEAEYKEVIQLSRSYAIGNADGIRENEDYDNAKYYYEQSLINANNAKDSEDAAYASEKAAESHMNDAETYKNQASVSEDNAETYMNNAKAYMDNAKTSETNAKESETKSSISEQNAKASENNAKTSETRAKASETNASASEANASTSEKNAKESETNANWYYNEVKDLFVGLNIVFIPKGTISFSELATVKETALAGYVYNIKDDFVTDDNFMEGSGATYTAGTNVYYVIDENGNGKWDAFGGSASPTATVDEIKDYLGI